MFLSTTSSSNDPRLRCSVPAIWLTLVFICFVTSAVAANPENKVTQKSSESKFKTEILPLLKTHCYDCHGPDDPEAMFDLAIFQTQQDVIDGFQSWETLIDRVNSLEMPPQDSDIKINQRERDQLSHWYKTLRSQEAERTAGDPGEVLARRLSSAEYNYTIRDLTGFDIKPTATFPIDPANEAGFDNSGESLTMSPALLSKYLDAARQVAQHLVLTPTGIQFAPHPVVTDTDRDKYCVKRIIAFYDSQPTDYADYLFACWRLQQEIASDLPDSKRISELANEQSISPKYLSIIWNLLHSSGHHANPIAYLQSKWNALPKGNENKAVVKQRCESLRDEVHQIRKQLTFRFPNLKVEGGHAGSQPFVLWRNHQYSAHRRLANLKPLTQSDTTDADPRTSTLIDNTLNPPENSKAREQWTLAVNSFCSVFPDALYISERGRDYVDDGSKQDGERGRLLSAGFHSMMGYFRDDRPLYDLILDSQQQRELDRLWDCLHFLTSDPERQYNGFLWFERTDSRYMRDPQFDFARPENRSSIDELQIRKLGSLYRAKAVKNQAGADELLAIDRFFDEINRQIRAVESQRLEAQPFHLNAITDFAQKAFRRPLEAGEITEIHDFYQARRELDGLSHEDAIQDTLVSILMSPYFCYRLDLATRSKTVIPLDDHEIGNRLSYFLWSSMPDQVLYQRASQGELNKNQTLVTQANRMLDNEKSRALAIEFGGHWLNFRRFENHNSVDRERFPQFDDQLRQSMFEEPIELLHDFIQNDRPIVDLLIGNDTYVDRSLANHYGIPYPETARGWIHIPNASKYGRGGILGMSVFQTKNAPGLRTSPVKRGYWVIRHLLGEKIPAPPPDVPELPNNEESLGSLTLGEALALHRENESCSGCHQRFDSIGLAFEGFGPIGERRTHDLGGRPIEVKVVFPGQEESEANEHLASIKALKIYLQKHRQKEFVTNACKKLVSYALGRSIELSDEELIENMVNSAIQQNAGFKSLIHLLINSPQFRTKRGSSSLLSQKEP